MSHNDQNQADKNVLSGTLPTDLMYFGVFRKKYMESSKAIQEDPEADITSCGVLIVSEEITEGKYNMTSATFGCRNDIISTLSNLLIEKIKEYAPSDVKERKEEAEHFMKFFTGELMHELFNEYGEDNDDEYDDFE